MLQVHAHFEVSINQDLPSEQLLLRDETQYDVKHFNTKSFMVYEENPIVVLPKKRKPRPRIRANIKTKLPSPTSQESLGKKSGGAGAENIGADQNMGGNTYNGVSPFVPPQPNTMISQISPPSISNPSSQYVNLPSRHSIPSQPYAVSSAAVPVALPMMTTNHAHNSSHSSQVGGGRGRGSTLVATTTTTLTTTTTSVIPMNNPDLFFGYIFEDNEVILPTK
jgi:hypothetical protein